MLVKRLAPSLVKRLVPSLVKRVRLLVQTWVGSAEQLAKEKVAWYSAELWLAGQNRGSMCLGPTEG